MYSHVQEKCQQWGRAPNTLLVKECIETIRGYQQSQHCGRWRNRSP